MSDDDLTVGQALRRRRASSWSEGEDGKNQSSKDPFNLRRFITRQSFDFSRALREIKRGRKSSCWMWYILPTAPWVVKGQERGSYTNRQYALRDVDNKLSGEKASRAYLQRPTENGVNLRDNYTEIMAEIAKKLESGLTSVQLMGCLDAPKLKSSAEVFERASGSEGLSKLNAICKRVIAAMNKEPKKKKRQSRFSWRRTPPSSSSDSENIGDDADDLSKEMKEGLSRGKTRCKALYQKKWYTGTFVRCQWKGAKSKTPYCLQCDSDKKGVLTWVSKKDFEVLKK